MQRAAPHIRGTAGPSRRRWWRLTRTLVASVTVVGLAVAATDAWDPFATDAPATSLTDVRNAEPLAWDTPQPETGVDISYPQCGRTLRDLASGYVVVGLDGGMPDRPNPCFEEQWEFAQRQAGAAIYVNTADLGRGSAESTGRRMARDDLRELQDRGIEPGTPIWLDVELPEVWRESPERHRVVIATHLQVLADAGYPVGVYSAPSLWREITGGARLEVPTWVGIGTATAERAARTCRRDNFGGKRPDIVQRIGTGSDGLPLDRNLTCPGTDLAGLIRPL